MKNGLKVYKVKLSQRIFLNLLGIALLSVISLGSFWIKSKLTDYHNEVRFLKKSFSETKKLEIKNNILQIKDYIQWVQNSPLEPLTQTLTSQIEHLSVSVKATGEKLGCINNLLVQSFRDSISNSIVPIYILNNRGNIIHKFNPFEKNENKILQVDSDILRKILIKKNIPKGIVTLYATYIPNDSILETVAYYDNTILPGFQVISVANKNYFERILQVHILDSISRLRFDKNDYIFINSFEGKALITNGEYNKVPIDISTSGNAAWMDIFKVQQTAAKFSEGVFHTYTWPKLSSSNLSLKTSYFSFLPRWKWIIGTGFYEDDFNLIVEQKKETLFADLKRNTLNVSIYLLLSGLLCYLVVFFFSKRLKRNIELFKKFFEASAKENLFIDKSLVNYLEFVHMADAANHMIEERNKAENDRHKSEEKFSKAFKNSPDAIIISSLDGIILEANESTSRITGYSREEIIGGSIIKLKLWNRIMDRNRYTISMMQNNRVYNLEADFKMKSGEIRNGLISGEILEIEEDKYMLSVIRDITDYKNMEIELLGLESRFRETLENVHLISVLLDVEGNITFCNNYLLDLTGYKRAEIIGHNWLELFDPDYDSSAKPEFLGNILAGKITTFQESQIKKKNGEKLSVHFNNTLLRDAKGNIIGSTSIGEDITVRKRTEKALRDSEAYYRFLFEQNPVPMLIYELGSLKMLAVNEAFTNHYGYAIAETLSMKLSDLYPEEERQAIAELTGKLSGLAYAREWHHIKKDGSYITIEAHSHGFSFDGRAARIAVVYDVTNRKKIEESLRINENQLSAIFNTISDILYFISIEPNDIYRFVAVNEMFLKVTGLKKEDVINKNFDEVIPKPAHELVLSKYREAIETKQAVFWEEVSEYPTGKKYGMVKVTPTYNSNGICTNLVGSVHDITAIRETENEIRKFNVVLENRVIERTAQLEAINKELESFSYSVSHDLRAPLRHINGYVELLTKRNRDQLTEKGKHYLQSISEASNQMGVLIDDLLQFSRTGRMEMKLDKVDMNRLVKEALVVLEHDIRNRNIIWNIMPLFSTNGDFSMLRQVWINLISNAIKYTRQRDITHIEIGATDEATEIVYFVRDNGAGFDMNYVNKLFGVFQRLHNNSEFEGSGIGLANVRQIIKRHNGRTWATGEIDKGATFYFSLPKI